MSYQNHEIGHFADKTVNRLDRIKRALTLDGWTRLMLGTPVDLGQARGGWKATADDIDLAIPDRPRRGESTLPPPEVPTLAPSMDPERVYWITNNVAHITFLAHGSSSQAPSGWPDAALEQTRSAFESLVSEVVESDGGL